MDKLLAIVPSHEKIIPYLEKANTEEMRNFKSHPIAYPPSLFFLIQSKIIFSRIFKYSSAVLTFNPFVLGFFFPSLFET